MKTTLAKAAATVGLAVVLGAGTLWAGEKAIDQKTEAPKAVQSAEPERRVDYTLEGLSHALDLWHDALLKEDHALAARYEKLIDNILVEDLAATELASQRLEKKCDSDGMNHAKAESKEESDRVKLLIEEKKELARQIRSGSDFGEKYRRLGIYINLLRRELGMPKVKFADLPARKN